MRWEERAKGCIDRVKIKPVCFSEDGVETKREMKQRERRTKESERGYKSYANALKNFL